MIRDFKITDELHIGYYTSLISSAFAMAQFVSGIPWGSLSDRIGRKPVVLMGLACTSLGVLLFGLSKSFAWAFATKIFSGAFASIYPPPISMYMYCVNLNLYFRMVTFGLGSIVGAALGGYLASPVEKYPDFFSNLGPIKEFLVEYPYFLPCFFATCLSTFCWFLGFFFMDETLYLKGKSDNEEQRPLMAAVETEEYSTFTESVAEGSENSNKNNGKKSFSEILTPPILAISLLYAVVAFQMLYFDELLPIWSATPKDAGGLGFESREIGTILSYAGSVMLFVQVFVLHRLTAIFGLFNLFQISLLSSALIYFALGLCRLLYQIPDLSGQANTKFWVWFGLIFCLTIKSLAQTIAITTSVILLNNSVTRFDTLGFINGFSQCCNAAMRALSPAVAGFIWSSAITSYWISLEIRAYISWGVLGVIGCITFFTGTRLNPLHYNQPHKVK
ncbi:hypothetical protein INT48_001604 [Thamnidium elegans]|uniref:Major facilitator superfamily (MFS) profile domain-containing protein n=1 Tax=Thamnidium elegans TaxID=101142 RepID=A0A8H7SS30_9FUNG|nr:hypothetical protein INT48_001604 [Thamnidium elegans]